MIQVYKWQTGVPSPDLNETLRYMGVRGKMTADARTQALYELMPLVNKGIQRVKDRAVSRGCYAQVPIEIIDDEHLIIIEETVCSKSLARHLKGCHTAFLMAATIGIEVDRLIRTYSRISSADCLAIDAAGSAAVEWVCDELNEMLCDLVSTEGKKLRRRFSPGYGDFPLSYQRSLIKILNLPITIGVTLNDSLMMSPTKSVTAIIGIE